MHLVLASTNQWQPLMRSQLKKLPLSNEPSPQVRNQDNSLLFWLVPTIASLTNHSYEPVLGIVAWFQCTSKSSHFLLGSRSWWCCWEMRACEPTAPLTLNPRYLETLALNHGLALCLNWACMTFNWSVIWFHLRSTEISGLLLFH